MCQQGNRVNVEYYFSDDRNSSVNVHFEDVAVGYTDRVGGADVVLEYGAGVDVVSHELLHTLGALDEYYHPDGGPYTEPFVDRDHTLMADLLGPPAPDSFADIYDYWATGFDAPSGPPPEGEVEDCMITVFETTCSSSQVSR